MIILPITITNHHGYPTNDNTKTWLSHEYKYLDIMKWMVILPIPITRPPSYPTDNYI